MLICVRWEKSMCLAAKGRLQGWAAKLLLLWVGIFHFFSFQICNHVTAVSFFGLRTTTEAMGTGGLRAYSLSHGDKVNAGAKPAKCTSASL